jgi:hypothetical protein
MGQYGVLQAGSTAAQGLLGGIQAKAEDDALREQLARYGQNIGTVIPMPVYNPATGKYEYPNQSVALNYDKYGNADLGIGG